MEKTCQSHSKHLDGRHMSNKNIAPYKEGEVLALCGPNVYQGVHLFVADSAPVLRGKRWHFGFRPWGKNHEDGCELRHATESDIKRLMRLEMDGLSRAINAIQNLQRISEVFEAAAESNDEPAESPEPRKRVNYSG